MRLTLIHPCIGRHAGDTRYIRSWQMEPLAPAVLAGLTPGDVAGALLRRSAGADPVRRADRPRGDQRRDLHRDAQLSDRKRVPAARRSGSDGRISRHPVSGRGGAIRGATVVSGEAEERLAGAAGRFPSRRPAPVVPRNDAAGSRLAPAATAASFAASATCPSPSSKPGAVATGAASSARCRPTLPPRRRAGPSTRILAEIAEARTRRNFFFFVDDNITSNMEQAKEFFRALIPLRIRWVSQASINAAHDEEFLELIARSGCQGLLVGLREPERSDPAQRCARDSTPCAAAMKWRSPICDRHNIRLYATFIFGYDDDTPARHLYRPPSSRGSIASTSPHSTT